MMAPENGSGKPRFSLYADLLDPSAASAPGIISSAPVTYRREGDASSPSNDEAAKKQQALAASLRFQPPKRPQIAAQKAKAKAIASKYSQTSISQTSVPPPPPPTTKNDSVGTSVANAAPPPPAAPAPQTSIADWTATASDDDNNLYGGEKRQRGGRKKRKKNREAQQVAQNWDDIYDPSRPTNYDEYKQSEEKIREIQEWKDRLYAHRLRRRLSDDYNSDESVERPERPMNRQFAPPSSLNKSSSPPPPPPASRSPETYDDPTGQDAYARRMRIAQAQSQLVSDAGPGFPPPLPPPPPSSSALDSTAQISRAPVRYSLPPPPPDIPATDEELAAAIGQEQNQIEDEPRSNRPGQKGFAERLMSKYGWTKGTGLGAQGTGIINPLFAKADKRKKKSDAEGGGFRTPTATGKILGGQKSKAGQQQAEGKFGAMSEVIKLEGMLKGLDFEQELHRAEGGIMQEIGEECGDKYGKVERVYVASELGHSSESGPPVFVKFVSQLSALRAVNALEGRIFNGNAIKARFWPTQSFDAGSYD